MEEQAAYSLAKIRPLQVILALSRIDDTVLRLDDYLCLPANVRVEVPHRSGFKQSHNTRPSCTLTDR
jgi:hypothetical protein